MHSILIIEDDKHVAETLQRVLEHEGYAVVTAVDGKSGLLMYLRIRPSLIILDLGLPDMSGMDILSALRESTSTPVIVLSGYSGEADRVAALRTGANDFVAKPFSLPELIQRVRLQVAYHTSPRNDTQQRTVIIGEVIVDTAARTVSRRGKTLRLRPKEYELLMKLFEARGDVVRRADLLRDVWRYPSGVKSRTLDAHIAALREKIEPIPDRPKHILTVRGTGYRLVC